MENPFETEKTVRSIFLTVLCILTFVESGWGLISSLFNLVIFSPERIVLQIQEITNFAGAQTQSSSWTAFFMNSSLEVLQTTIMHGAAIYSFAALFALMSLGGAFLMFKLKKSGFYLYVVAQVAQLMVLPMYSGWNSVVVLSMIMSGFFALLFIILYGVNYSKLNN